MTRCFALCFAWFLLGARLLAADANRLAYLDEFCDPYYPHRGFAKLTTPQWVGERDVECVVVLAIDDMRDAEKYETYLRPILDRLKQIDGRAPVSIMTCQADPQSARLQQWLKEGVSLEVHTFDHPCPCLAGGDFAKSKATYDKCVDLMHSIPGNQPVAFRMPCCDSLNTPSPRFWMEVFNQTTEQGRFLSIDTSVFNIITGKDTALPAEIRLNAQGEERFRRYVPFKSFVNTIEDYPYPYVIGKLCWQFPCVVPSDWSAQHVQKPNNPDTVRDLKLALDAAVIKQGVYNLVFHPHGWIRNDQVVELIDHAVAKHGQKVKFLNFRECDQRLRKNLLAGQSLRNAQGEDNGVRILDVNADGYLDVIVGNDALQQTRVWNPSAKKWTEVGFPDRFDPRGPRFGVLTKDDSASCVSTQGKLYQFREEQWIEARERATGIPIGEIAGDSTSKPPVDRGVRLRDLDRDGVCELILGGASPVKYLRWGDGRWMAGEGPFPANVSLVNEGQDVGLRFIDLDGDRDDDLVVANEKQQGVWLFDSIETGWKPVQLPTGFEIPHIAREGRNNGAWFHSGQLWWQNENTNRLPDHVDRRSFAALLGMQNEAESKPSSVKPTITPTDRKSAAGQEATEQRIKEMGAPKSPAEAIKSIVVPQGFKVELVACEPLVVDPVAFDWGPDGRLWVVEMRDYPRGIDDHGKPGGRVKVLTDTDGDGKYDEAKLFLDDLPFPTGIKVWRKGVLVTAAPDVIYAEDTNNDGRADVKQVLYRGFGEGNQQHRVSGLRWGLDGWLYLGNGDSGGKIESLASKATIDIGGRDLRIRPDTGELEAVSGATQYSLCFDDFGQRFGGNNSNPVWHYLIEDYYFKRNPHIKPPQTKQQISVTPGNAPVFPLSKTVTRFNDYHTANRFTSACGIESYRDDYLGKPFYGNSFVCEPVHNLVHREVVERDGISFKSRRADSEQAGEFLASSDNWFRPVMARTGPDGALYIADMYRLVIEHPTWIPADWQAQLNLRAGDDKGRIYRVVRDNEAPRKIARLDTMDTAQLVEALRSPSGTRRDLAQQMLIWKQDGGELVRKLIQDKSPPAPVRVHALWTLAALGKLQVADVLAALAVDENLDVLCAAVQLADLHFPKDDRLIATFQALLEAKVADSPRVALALALALERWPGEPSGALLAKLAKKHQSNEVVLTAAMVSVTDGEKLRAFFNGLSDDHKLSERVEAATTQLARHLQDTTINESSWKELADDARWKSPASRLRRAAQLLSAARDQALPQGVREQMRTVVTPLTAQARSLLLDDKQPLADRIAAAKLLMLQDVWASTDTKPPADYRFAQALLVDSSPTELKAEVLQGIRASRSFPFNELLYNRWSDRTQTQRREILDTLVTNDHARAALLNLLDAKLLLPTDLDATRAQLLGNHPDPQVRKKAAELTKIVTFSDRAELVARYADVLELTGDVARGRAAFRKRCTACHKQEGEGKTIGPDLTSLTDKSARSLLTAMLDPNRAVEAKFVEYLVITDGGQLVTGIVSSETGTSLTLVGADGKEQSLLRTEIEELRSNKKSLMPEGFERDLEKQDFADLIAYLQATAHPPKKFAGNMPELVKARSDGVVELPATAARLYGPTIVFEAQYKNAGYWQSTDDLVQWSLEVPASGKYDVVLDYACDASAAGNTLELTLGKKTFPLKVPSTGNWDNYQQRKLGTVDLRAGPADVSVRSSGAIRGALLDLRSVRLEPVK